MKALKKNVHCSGRSLRTVVSESNIEGSSLTRIMIVYPSGTCESYFKRFEARTDNTTPKRGVVTSWAIKASAHPFAFMMR